MCVHTLVGKYANLSATICPDYAPERPIGCPYIPLAPPNSNTGKRNHKRPFAHAQATESNHKSASTGTQTNMRTRRVECHHSIRLGSEAAHGVPIRPPCPPQLQHGKYSRLSGVFI